MSVAVDPAAWCRRFIERRCSAPAPAPLLDEPDGDETEDASRAPVLSLAEADVGDAAEGDGLEEYLAVLALRMSGDRVVLRFLTPSAMRSALRTVGSRRLITDLAVRTPEGLDEVSMLIYRIRSTPRIERALAAIETTIEMFDAAPDDDGLVLGRAVLEQFEVLDADDAVAVVVSGSRLALGAVASPGRVREVAVVATPPGAAPLGDVMLRDRKIVERSSGVKIAGQAYAILRLGPRSTRESVLELIDEIRRRHQRQSQTGAGSESFETFLGRQADEAKEKVIEAMFGHLNTLPAVAPIVIDAAANVEAAVDLTESPPGAFQVHLAAMRAEIEEVFGLRIPGVRVRIDTDLVDGTYNVLLDEIPLESNNVFLTKVLCLADAADVAGAEQATRPDGSGGPACWIPAERAQAARLTGLETWDASKCVERHLRSLILRNLGMFATIDEIERLLSEAGPNGAALDAVRSARGGLPRFMEVVHALLHEQLPVIPIEPIAARHLELADRAPDEIVEEMRLLPAIRTRVVSDVARWQLFALDAGHETTIRAGISREGDAAVLALEPETVQAILSAVRHECGDPADDALTAIVVEDHALRPFAKSLIEVEFPRVRVVARRELAGVAAVPAPIATVGR